MSAYYEDDRVTIYNGDCLRLLEWRNADVMVTDPPYGIGWSRSANHARSSKAHDGIVNDGNTTVRDAALTVFGRKPGIVFGSFYAPQPSNVAQVLVWHKPADAGVVGSVTGYRRDAEPVYLTGPWPQRTVEWSSVLRSTREGIAAVVAETGHPHTKPVDIMRDLISRCPEGVIVDPFMGSGSTLLAAKQLNRRAIGVELDERYCEVAAKRLAQEQFDMGGAA